MYDYRDGACSHITGLNYFDYEGYSLVFEGEKFSGYATEWVEFNYCPTCGKYLKKEV